MLKFHFMLSRETWWIWLFWILAARCIHCEGEKESRESTQKAFYAKYVVMVHLSQSVKLFLNFHDLYFCIFIHLKTIISSAPFYPFLFILFRLLSYSSEDTVKGRKLGKNIFGWRWKWNWITRLKMRWTIEI